LEAQVLKCAEILKKKRRYVPDIVIGGGFINETQIFKAIAMSNFGEGPYVKANLMARAPITSVMKSTYFVELAKKGKLPRAFVDRYGEEPDKFFRATPELVALYGKRFKEIPWGAVGLYSFLRGRIGVGLQQLMSGVRKWKLDMINSEDLVSLTERAAKVSGISLLEEAETDVIKRILD
jgi:hypothetical protein